MGVTDCIYIQHSVNHVLKFNIFMNLWRAFFLLALTCSAASMNKKELPALLDAKSPSMNKLMKIAEIGNYGAALARMLFRSFRFSPNTNQLSSKTIDTIILLLKLLSMSPHIPS